MLRFALGGALLVAALLAACGPEPPHRSVGSTPTGTDASTGQPSVSARGFGPGGINREALIGIRGDGRDWVAYRMGVCDGGRGGLSGRPARGALAS